jgi:hypothetical protein
MFLEIQMTTRRKFITTAAIAASSLAWTKTALAQPTPEAPKEADFLFVQSAKGMKFDKSNNKLTLTGISPVTIYFTDRPDRIAGNMKTARFIPFWSEGKDSFKSNPPNADISIVEGSELKQIIVELQEPVLKDDNLTYTVKILQGTMPATGDDVSVFIDIIGRPLTPMSFAGVARRGFRRGFYR